MKTISASDLITSDDVKKMATLVRNWNLMGQANNALLNSMRETLQKFDEEKEHLKNKKMKPLIEPRLGKGGLDKNMYF